MRRLLPCLALLSVAAFALSAGATGSTRVFVPFAPKVGVIGSPGTSEALIEQARASGQISDETALVYRTFAAFGDPRLPAQYRGDDSGVLDSGVLRDVADNWSTLSADARATLDPFFMPPMYQGSWGDPATRAAQSGTRAAADAPPCSPDHYWNDELPPTLDGWVKIPTAHANVWYPSNGDPFSVGLPVLLFTGAQAKAAAQLVADNVEHVWAAETGLFGRDPLPDFGVPCSGNDGKLDIYIYRRRLSAGAMTAAFPPGCMARPAYMWIAPDFVNTDDRAKYVLSHEFMHTIDFSYPHSMRCGDYTWLGEATANEMVDYVYPDLQAEQTFAQEYMHHEHRASLPYPFDRAYPEWNGYSDYVFFFYLAHSQGFPVLKDIWDATQTNESLTAIDKGTQSAGGLAKLWPLFSAYLWNDWDSATFGLFYQWDHLKYGIKEMFNLGDNGAFGYSWYKTIDVDLKGAQSHEWKLEGTSDIDGGWEVDPVANQYDHLTFSDDNARSIAIYNPYYGGSDPHASFQALIKIQGQDWKLEDWTKLPARRFCRDRADERLDELVLIYSNWAFTDGSKPLPANPQDPKLVATNVGCDKWQGTATGTYTSKVAGWTMTSAAADVVFERQRFSDDFDTVENFVPTGGQLTWTMTGGTPQCAYSGGPTVVPLGSDDGSMRLTPFADDANSRNYFVTGASPRVFTFSSCVGTQQWVGASYLQTGSGTVTVSADGQTMDGSVVLEDDAQFRQTYTWHLTAVRGS